MEIDEHQDAKNTKHPSMIYLSTIVKDKKITDDIIVLHTTMHSDHERR